MRAFTQQRKALLKANTASFEQPIRAFSGQNRNADSILYGPRPSEDHAVQPTLPFQTQARAGMQPKLTVRTPGDIYEQEADRVADRVMRMPEPKLQRRCACGATCQGCQTELADWEHEQTTHSDPSGLESTTAPSVVHDVLRTPGQALDPTTRGLMESRFGYDFSRVRVHHDQQAAQSAAAVAARAYTVGSWLTDKSQPHYFSSRFLVLKAETGLATHGILLFRCHRGFGVRFTA